MTTQEAKKIRIAYYLQSLGYIPVKQQGKSLWYKSPFREETEASFKLNTELNQWYDFGTGKGGNIIALARVECKELHFVHNGKPYFAIGFPNVAGGYEVRNRFFKGCIAPKDISHIRQSGEPREKCLVFEGMTDYLSFLTLRMKNCPIMPNLDGQDYVILNSVSNVSKAIDVLHGYERIHSLLDNDEAGRKAYWELAGEFAGRIRDFSQNYNGYKDLNDYLCGKPLFQSAEPIKQEKQVQSARRMMHPPKKRGLKM